MFQWPRWNETRRYENLAREVFGLDAIPIGEHSVHATAEIDTRTRAKTLTNVRRTATRIPDNSTRALHVTAITLTAASERVCVSCFLFVYASSP